VLGCELDRLEFDEAVALCEEVIDGHGFAQHMAINAAKLVEMHSDPRLREIVQACELVTADGQAVVWASRLLGDPLPERVAGIDLMEALFARAAVKGYRVYVLGAEKTVLERAMSRARMRWPGLQLAGYRDGYFEASDDERVAREIRDAKPDVLFVAMSSPRKEYFLGEHGRGVGASFVMGVGGAIDVMAGVTRRAPRVLQRTGLEWLFRLAQEPRRLFRRYAVTNARFLSLVVNAVSRRVLRRSQLTPEGSNRP
jgi:N-acetylglucosaminyldiphosphoundecaprenol N-acetyl-beta-D-mannosaminyltransferase